MSASPNFSKFPGPPVHPGHFLGYQPTINPYGAPAASVCHNLHIGLRLQLSITPARPKGNLKPEILTAQRIPSPLHPGSVVAHSDGPLRCYLHPDCSTTSSRLPAKFPSSPLCGPDNRCYPAYGEVAAKAQRGLRLLLALDRAGVPLINSPRTYRTFPTENTSTR